MGKKIRNRKKAEKREKKKDKAVKIDSELLEKVEEFISRKENKLKFASLKQFIDNAVLDRLEKELLLGKEAKPENLKETEAKIKQAEADELKKIFNIKKEARVPSGII